ncbi:MAG: glycosyltransferase family 4 protein [Bacteroidales bacterium]|nr:glycosyltransferase family 4 protein [Bacteroidales bacterium]
MKIIELIPSLDFGGAERFVADICNSFVSKGNHVVLITFCNAKGKDSFYPVLSDKVELKCLGNMTKVKLLYPFFILYYILKERPTVVHSHLNSVMYLFFSLFLSKKIKFVHTVHNDAYKEAGGYWGRVYRKFTMGRFILPVTISKESQKSFYSMYNRSSCLIYNGRSLDESDKAVEKQIFDEILRLKDNPDSFVIVNLARFAEQKNQLSLVKAVNRINEKKQIIDLYIIGSYSHSKEAIDIYNNISRIRTSNIHLLGAKNNASIYLNFADAFCLSSIFEGMPISIIESFSKGCPVLSTPVGGVVDMVEDGVNGLLSKDTNIESIVDMLDRFCGMSSGERARLSENAKESYALYSMDTCTSAYLSCFYNNTQY